MGHPRVHRIGDVDVISWFVFSGLIYVCMGAFVVQPTFGYFRYACHWPHALSLPGDVVGYSFLCVSLLRHGRTVQSCEIGDHGRSIHHTSARGVVARTLGLVLVPCLWGGPGCQRSVSSRISSWPFCHRLVAPHCPRCRSSSFSGQLDGLWPSYAGQATAPSSSWTRSGIMSQLTLSLGFGPERPSVIHRFSQHIVCPSQALSMSFLAVCGQSGRVDCMCWICFSRPITSLSPRIAGTATDRTRGLVMTCFWQTEVISI